MQSGWFLGTFCVLAVFAGCTGPSDRDPGEDEAGQRGWTADCSSPAAQIIADGVCATFFAPSREQQSEAHLAVHPTDAYAVTVTWAEWASADSIRHWSSIYAASTKDGGESWAVSRLIDPSLEAAGFETYAFDSVVAYGPDGAIYVVFGGNDLSPGGLPQGTSTITVARSVDLGLTWTYHTVTTGPLTQLWDYMDLAIAPDDGTIYVQAQSVRRGLYVWRSQDQAETWDGPALVIPGGPGYYEPRSAMGQLARTAAGPNGTVVLHYSFDADSEPEMAITVSHDHGRTWGGITRTPFIDRTFLFNPTSAPLITKDAETVTLIQPSGYRLQQITLEEGGRRLTDVRELATTDHLLHWTMGARTPGGQIGALVNTFDECEDRPGWAVIAFLPVNETGHQEIALASGDAPPVGCRATNEYGGFAFAADGSVWAAWSDPRESTQPRIAVAHLLPP